MTDGPENGANRHTPEGGDYQVDGEPQIKMPSRLSMLNSRLEELVDGGRVQYIGLHAVSHTDTLDYIPDDLSPTVVESVDFYVAPAEPLVPSRRVGIDRQLMAAASNLAGSLGVGSGGGWANSGGAEAGYGTITTHETVVHQAVIANAKVSVNDLSTPVIDKLGDRPTNINNELVRRITVKVFTDRQTADQEFRHDRGEIDRKQYDKERLRLRHPVAAKVFDRLARRTPRAPQG